MKSFMCRLRVFAEQRIVVGGARFRHRAQPFAVDAFCQQPFTNQPVCFIGGLLQTVIAATSEPNTSDSDSFSAPDCLKVDKPGFGLGHAVAQLMRYDVYGDGKAAGNISLSPSPNTIC